MQHTPDQHPPAAQRPLSTAPEPLTASTVVQTTGVGLLCGEVLIDCAGFALPAYRAVHLGATHAPVVLVLPEIFGPHAFYADYRPGYRHALAQAAWGEMPAWFASNGVAPQCEFKKDSV